jgi:hypothetical protein
MGKPSKGGAETESFKTKTKPAPDGALIGNSGWGGLLPTTAHVGIVFHCIPAFLQSALVKGCGM